MATVKTIKPAGGGDYTTLALWEDAVDGESSASQWAECYTGGNLGAVNLSGWASTPDSDNYPKIYAAEEHQHNADSSSGAYINATTPIETTVEYTQIDGIRISGTSNTATAISLASTSSGKDCRVDNCFIHGTFGLGILIGQTGGSGLTSSTYATNNIIVIDGTANTSPVGIAAYATDGSSGTTNVYIYNNSIYVANPSTLTSYGLRFANTASCAINITVENNIIIGPVTSSGASITYAYDQIAFNSGSKVFNNNISSDNTADDFGGSYHQLNEIASNIWEAATSLNFKLTKTSVALNFGKTISSVTTDMVGISRPQGKSYDMGALERYTKIEMSYGVPKPFEIPSSIVSSHEYITDSLISGPTGQSCQLIYPITKNSVCPNCIYSPRQKKSSNIYKTNGPIPFENHTTCPWCGGEGRSSRAIKETIKLRVYWTQRDWSIFGSVENPDSSAMVIGHIYNLPKLEKADRILLNKNLSPYRDWIFERKGEAIPWGLAQDRYFAQMLERTGGG